MILNQDNYYDDRGRIYMSCSTFQNYMTCEAMAQAIEYQEWKPEKPDTTSNDDETIIKIVLDRGKHLEECKIFAKL